MPLLPLEHLRHILDEADYLSMHIRGVDREQFNCDETLKRAFVRDFSEMGWEGGRADHELSVAQVWKWSRGVASIGRPEKRPDPFSFFPFLSWTRGSSPSRVGKKWLKRV